jgi:hypothetical protein
VRELVLSVKFHRIYFLVGKEAKMELKNYEELCYTVARALSGDLLASWIDPISRRASRSLSYTRSSFPMVSPIFELVSTIAAEHCGSCLILVALY